MRLLNYYIKAIDHKLLLMVYRLITSRVLPTSRVVYQPLYNNQINACALIGQSAIWFIVPVNPRKNRASSELLYKSNRPQVSMGYRLINHLGCW